MKNNIKLTKYQKNILDCLSKGKSCLVVHPRQAGLSTVGYIAAIEECKKENRKILFVTPNTAQSRIVNRRILEFIENKKIIKNHNQRYIEFKNGSSIEFYSDKFSLVDHNNRYSLIIIDNAGFIIDLKFFISFPFDKLFAYTTKTSEEFVSHYYSTEKDKKYKHFEISLKDVFPIYTIDKEQMISVLGSDNFKEEYLPKI